MADSDAGPAVGAVQVAVAGIENIDDLPVAEHVARFDAVHRALTDALSAIDGA